MVDHDDEALSRLRASDPATGSHPDLHSLRTRIAQKAPASQGSDTATRVDDDLVRGPGLRAPWLAAAAVVALGLGAGGYALGLQQGEGQTPTTAGGAQADPASPGLQPGADALLEMGAASTAAPGEGYAEADSGSMAYDPGPVRLVAGQGLPAGPGTAEVRALTSDQSPEDFLAGWAEAMGFEGEPLEGSDTAGMLIGGVGAGLVDGEGGRLLHASDEEGGLTFAYEDIFDGEYCTMMFEGLTEEDLTMARDEWESAYGETIPFPDESSCRTPTGPAPTEEEARAAATEFFAQAGIDIDGYSISFYESEPDSSFVMVDGWPKGMEYSQLNVSATIGPDGVVSAYGTSGEFASLGDYPVISATEAVQRYGTREFSTDYGVSLPEDNMPVGDDMASQTWVEPDYTMPENGRLEPGDKIPFLLKDKTVVDAELVQGTIWVQGAGSIEVPAWKLLTGDGMHYSVLALSDEALDFQSWE